MTERAAPHRSRRRLGLALVASILAALTAFAGLALAIHDGKGKKRLVPVSRSDAGAIHLARAIFEGNGRHFVRAKFVTTPPGATPVAISNRPLSGFPRRGGSFAILSTGCAVYADRPNRGGATGCRGGGVKVRGARDVTIWRIRVRVPRGANCLSFRFKFLSEEFPEFVGTQFNDAFIAELDRSPNWTTNGNRDPVIQAPRNFATTRDGNLISVNATRNARVTRAAARGTTYDAATGKLRASTPVRPGSRLLYLSIFDQGDRQWDSAVFIDRLLVRKAKRCRSGVVGSK
ncbi:MAG: choice-of-anchor L domain-containing protein [Solirubrobacterales bacterium]